MRVPENNVGEAFLVKKVQTPGAEPDQVDQKNREHNDCETQDREKPLQNAFKHGSTCSPLISDWSIKTLPTHRQRRMRSMLLIKRRISAATSTGRSRRSL